MPKDKEIGHAEVTIHRGADRRGAEGGRGGAPCGEILRKYGISRNTYFNWKAKYGGATIHELRRLRELELENAKHKRMCAELALENAVIQDVLSRK